MSPRFIAALPMYDWPERRAEVDAEWTGFRRVLAQAGIDAPERLTRRNGDMPAVKGGIRDAAGTVIAPDPATLDPDGFDLHTLWRHPGLIFGQTCWGPLQAGLDAHLAVVGQPDYSDIEGGEGPLYSSAIVMRRGDAGQDIDCPAPVSGAAVLPLDRLRGRVFTYNSADSMSGYLRLRHDLRERGETLSLFRAQVETGAHRTSLKAVAEGRADVAAIDARSWDLARRYEPAAQTLAVVGWTSRSTGLPFVRAKGLVRPAAFYPDEPALS